MKRGGVRDREIIEKRKKKKKARDCNKGFPVWRIQNDCSFEKLITKGRGRGGVLEGEIWNARAEESRGGR